MAALEGSFKSLLQGVSQQVQREQLPGQVLAQENMLSDLVTGLRRRPGFRFGPITVPPLVPLPAEDAVGRIAAWFGMLDDSWRHVLVDTRTGAVYILTLDGALVHRRHATSMEAPSADNIRFAPHEGDLFILNTASAVPFGPVGQFQVHYGWWFQVGTGLFNTTYALRIEVLDDTGVVTDMYEAQYTTPAGTNPGDAAQSTPQYISQQLMTVMNTSQGLNSAFHYSATQTGLVAGYSSATVYENQPRNIRVTSFGQGSITTSGRGWVNAEGQLPANLGVYNWETSLGPAPSWAGKLLARVQAGGTATYYVWDGTRLAWEEAPEPDGPVLYGPGPLQVMSGGSAASEVMFEGRLAGDEDTNPLPEFIRTGRMTGIASYQGRLVILSGNRVALSASRHPGRFTRSTVTQVLDDDPIEVGSVYATAADFTHALQFQRDLLLFADGHQAAIPAVNAALTPRNAYLALVSQYEADTRIAPIASGRSVLFPFQRGAAYSGVREMVPSEYVDGQYPSIDATQHIPQYLPGRVRFLTGDSANGSLALGVAGDLRRIVVHEYLWDTQTKLQQAWHEFTFPQPVVTAYFGRSTLYAVHTRGDDLVISSVDLHPERERVSNGPFLDLHVTQPVLPDNTVDLSEVAYLWQEDPNLPAPVVQLAEGALIGEPVGYTWEPGSSTLEVDPQIAPGTAVTVGVPYRSLITPPRPMMRDSEGSKIGTNKLTTLRYAISTVGSGEYSVEVQDRRGGFGMDQAPLVWSANELNLGEPRVAGESLTIVPMRVYTDTADVSIWTRSNRELNILQIEYVLRYARNIRRL